MSNQHQRAPQVNPNAQYMNASAPVSSLLPQIASSGGGNPMQQLQGTPSLLSGHQAASLQAQLASLLTQGSLTPSLAATNAAISAQSQLLASRAAPTLLSSTANMQDFTLDQLEQHVRLLQQLNQPVPPNVLMLLADARKRAEKRQTKRVANRKSACTSRARKKALVKEMTELNVQLRRQALILSLLPDIVIAIDESSKITFCSQQVERALGYEIDKITGTTISDMLIPESRDKLTNLVTDLLEGKKSKKKKRGGSKSRKSGKTSGTGNAVTENSFPLTVVDLGRAVAPSDENDVSDTSASHAKQPSSLTNSSESNVSEGSGKKQTKSIKKDQPSSDLSHSSDEAASKNLIQANANLERNVREHNTKMKKMKAAYKDDVTGAAVTANNASARLSSLEHHAGLSDDSGYRESNDSREEYSSSDGEKLIESQKRRRKPIALACNICLIRKDLSTIWCEVTSSLHTRSIESDGDESKVSSAKPASSSKKEVTKVPSLEKKEGSVDSLTPTNKPAPGEDTEEVNAVQVKEILLCLRPIREGEKIDNEEQRYRVSSSEGTTKEPPAKRQRSEQIDKVVVESLMSMSSQK